MREQFNIRPDIVFLNHGSFGACPKPVFNRYQAWQLELERQPVEFIGRRFGELMKAARERLAGFVNADAEDLVFVPNATSGINLIARSLPLQAGDEILSCDQEYGALDRMWALVCRNTGAVYKQMPITLPVTTHEDFFEEVWSGVSARTRVLFLSHITSPTGLTFPLEELIRRAKERGIWTIIDGAHVPGQLPLDLQALDADFYSGNCHKWLMAPKGAAFAYVKPELQGIIEPRVVSWATPSASDSEFIQENEFQGTRDIASYLTVGEAIKFFEENNWPAIRRQCHELVKFARTEMSSICDLPPIAPESGAWFQQMCAQLLPANIDGYELKRRLYDDHRVEVPVNFHNGQYFIRISVQGYNTREDVEIFLEAFHAVLKEMRS